MATPEQMSSYYDGYPDPKNPDTWGVSPNGVRNHSFSAAQATFEAAHGAAPQPSPVAGPSSPGSGMAAARAGDSTAHGGTIGPVTTGQAAMVFIGNMPAACMGDPHVCPMFSGPKAHAGGTITKGSATVLIGNKPAARVSDLTVCTSEPGQIAVGEMTVLIGDLSAAGGGSSARGSSSTESSSQSPKAPSSEKKAGPSSRPPGESEQRVGTGTHWVSIELVDETECPVVGEPYRLRLPEGKEVFGSLDANGRARVTGIQNPGACEISFVSLDVMAWHRWGAQCAAVVTSTGSSTEQHIHAGAEQPVLAGAAGRGGRCKTAGLGDCISSIAFESGHFWQTIWDHAANAELKRVRGNPNVLCTGDAVFVPDLRPKSDSGSLDQHYKFVRLGEPSKLLVRLLDDDDPRANTPWTLEFAGRNFDGVTDDDGNLAIPIRGNTKSVTLRVGHPGDEDVYQLDLGDVEPIETDSGVVARLENLGYLNNQNADTGNLSEAVRAFQARHGMKTTGQLDGETREKLRIEHGS